MLADQKELDDKILSNAGIEKYPLENIKLALLVELGELANEWQGFKHWKKHREINREKLLEEFADCLHFALSIENYVMRHDLFYDQGTWNLEEGEKLQGIEKPTIDEIVEGFRITFKSVLDLNYVLQHVLALGLCLDIKLKDMEWAYYKKNAVNYRRQEEGY